VTSSANGGSTVDATKAFTDDLVGGEPRVRLPAERYETLEVLGQGAMGIVYKARDRALDRVVAIKTIHPDQVAPGTDFSAITERLYQEATAAARLTHPGIVTIYDVTLTAGVPYVVMEYFKGRTLADLLSAGALPPQKAGQVILEVCRALEYAHAQGVIHRDVKSSNIMVDAGWHVKLADFGVARVMDKQSNRTGVMIGTPAYMSPEQVHGAAADARSDLFSLGVVLYEALTGQKPFPGDDVAKVLDEVLHLDPIPARERNFAVSPALDAVIRRVMSKEPQDRYPDAAAFADALMQALPPAPSSAPVALVRRYGRGRGALVAAGGLFATSVGVALLVVSLAGEVPEPERARAAEPSAADASVDTAASPVRSPAPVFTAAPEPDAKPPMSARRVPRMTAARDDTAPAPLVPAAPVERARTTAPDPTAAGAGSGCLSVNAVPFAAVYVDGQHVGDTPRACLRIRAGRHRIFFEADNERSPEHVVIVEDQHTAESPLRVSYDFRLRQFLTR
jgi:tRNA A-37 threonylcarbamoyl transferase component Bud32